jgi:ABC-type spermidine/putrescine transport system permease subunit I
MKAKVQQQNPGWRFADLWRPWLSRGMLLPLIPALVYLLVFYLYPLSRMILLSFRVPKEGGWTLDHYLHFFTAAIYLDRMLFTFKIALIVTVLCILLGYPVAYLLSSVPTRVRNLLLIMVVVPFWTSILVRTYAWMVLLGRAGIINQFLQSFGLIETPLKLMHNTFGVYVGMVYVLLPFTILPMYSVMERIDRALLQAALNLGASRWQTFWRVFFPLSLPGVASGALLVFIIALGFYITPALLGGVSDVMISNLIDTQINSLLDWEFGSAISVVLLVMALIVFYLYNRFLGLDRLLGGSA